MTIAEALRGGYHMLRERSSSAAIDTEILLAHVLRMPRAHLVAHGEDILPPKKQVVFETLLQRRQKGIPLPYITHTIEFFGRPFFVDASVLVPRPDSEALVYTAIKILQEKRLDTSNTTVVDVGTGSGILAVSIAKETRRLHVLALDRSGSALETARKNARKHRVLSRLSFLASDLLNNIPHDMHPQMIIANLPYVPSDDLRHAHLQPDTIGLTFEPAKALDGGPDGLHMYRRFFGQLKRMKYLQETCTDILLEHTPSQRKTLEHIAYEALSAFRPTSVSRFITHFER